MRKRILWWWRRNREEQDLEEEIRSHLAIEAGQLRESGDDPAAAESGARRAFGNRTRIAEETRDVWRFTWLEDLSRDVRYGLRQLARSPGFTITATLTLALGIGANASMFQMLDAVRLRTLPVEKPDRLAIIQTNRDQIGWTGRQTTGYPTITNPVWEQFRDTQQVFDGVLAWSNATLQMGDSDDSRLVRGLFVSGDFFRVLHLTPALGRFFTPAEDRRGCGIPGVVVSHQFWQNQLGGDRNAIGRNLSIKFQRAPILGVAPEDFQGVEVGRSFDVAVPICAQDSLGTEKGWLDSGLMWWLTVMGRLRDGQTMDTASSQLGAVSPGLFAATLPAGLDSDQANDYRNYRLRAAEGAAGVSRLRAQYTDPLILLLASTGLVLLLACANLANLILSRASTREREYSVRVAIGASRARLIRQLMVENGLLALSGTVVGLGVAAVLNRVLIGLLIVDGSPIALNVFVDLKTLAFLTGVSILTCLGFGILPTWQATRANAVEAMNGAGRSLTSSRRGFGMRQVLVVSQVALSLVLLFGALLFTGTLKNLLAVDTGFDPEEVTVARVDFSRMNLAGEQRAILKRELLTAIASAPGVTAAGEVRHVPLGGTGSRYQFLVRPADLEPTSVRLNAISEGYLNAMDIALLAGRDIQASDSAAAPRVALVNPKFIETFGLSGNPIGQIIRQNVGKGTYTAVEIVGVVKNTKYGELRENPQPLVFVPLTQEDDDPRDYADFVVRSPLPAATIGASIKGSVAGINGGITTDLRPYESLISAGVQRERLMATLSTYFGALAVLIAAIGLYGVISTLVVRRTAEIGLRMALGATQGNIMRMVIGHAAVLTGTGLAVGIALSLAAGRSAESMLYGLEPSDMRLAGLACLLLAGVAALAGYLPARRAARFDPMTALHRD